MTQCFFCSIFTIEWKSDGICIYVWSNCNYKRAMLHFKFTLKSSYSFTIAIELVWLRYVRMISVRLLNKSNKILYFVWVPSVCCLYLVFSFFFISVALYSNVIQTNTQSDSYTENQYHSKESITTLNALYILLKLYMAEAKMKIFFIWHNKPMIQTDSLPENGFEIINSKSQLNEQP